MGRIWVSDIDGTISDGGDPITAVVRHLQSVDGPVYIVSARSTDDLESTREWLRDNEVPFRELILNPDGGDPTAFKVRVAERLLAADHDIVEWLENNPDTRRALDAMGINALGPSAVRFMPTQIEVRVDSVPGWLRDNARRGLRWLDEGYGGDGLTAKTLAEARAMAGGQVSDDKAIRMAAWFARHMGDLEGTDRNTDPPTAGMVAHALWGGWPIDESRRAQRWAAESTKDETMRNASVKMETRTFTVDDIEVREAGDGMSFTGYAAVFNSPSEPLPFTETIAPGAFRRSLSSRNNVFMLLNHDPAVPLASTRSKTLSLSEDGTGLRAEAKLPETTAGRDLAVLLRDGIVNSMSFGFSVPKGGDSWSQDGMTRTLNQVRLHEVSVVAFPAYAATSASVRSVDMLADKTGEDADALAAAITSLESGGELTRDQAALLETVIGKLAPAPEPIPAPVVPSLDLLRDQLDLAYKAL